MTPLELIEAHAPMVRSLIRLHLGRGPDAEDAWQDIYLLVHRGWPGYRGTAAPRTWLYRVVLNALLTHHRRSRHRRTSSLDDLTPGTTPASDPHPQHDAAEVLYTALARLDPLERTVIALHLEGFDYTEIADVTGLSAGAVGVRIHRIRKRLTTWISPSTP